MSSLLSQLLRRNQVQIIIGVAALCLVNGLELVLPLIFAGAIDELTLQKEPLRGMFFYAVLYIVATSLQAGCRVTWRYVLTVAGTRCSAELRERLMSAVAATPPWLMSENKRGDIVSLTTSDTDSVSRLFDGGVITFVDAFFCLFTIPIVLFYLDPVVALAVLLPLSVIPWMVRKNEDQIRERFSSAQASLDLLSRQATESFSALRTIKTLSAHKHFSSRFKSISTEYTARAILLSKTEATFGPSLEVMAAISFSMLFIVGGYRAIDGALSIGAFLAIYRYISQLSWPLQATAMAFSLSERARTSAKRVEKAISQSPEPQAESFPQPFPQLFPQAFSQRANVSPCSLQVDAMVFAYPEQQRPVFDRLDLSVAAGERVALVGDVGSGKSSAIALIHGVEEPTSGQILIDSLPRSPRERRALSGWMSQEPFLFEVSIRENLLLSQAEDRSEYRSELTDVELWDVLETVSLTAEVRSFVQGLDTVVGERGTMLSGGQRQRLALARALLRPVGLLLLDDPLSAVDIGTETAILNALALRKETIVYTAHRLSSLSLATRILVLEHGSIVQQGTQEQLRCNQKGWFARLCKAQLYMEASN